GFTIRSTANGIIFFKGGTAYGNVFDSTADTSSAVDVAGTGTPIIQNNTFTDDGAGSRTGVQATSNATITDNVFTDLSRPIDILAGASASVTENDISGTNANSSSRAIAIAPVTGSVN